MGTISEENEKEVYKALQKLVGHKVVDVTEFVTGPTDTGFLIHFDNGVKLGAQDGEYGCNAFYIEEE